MTHHGSFVASHSGSFKHPGSGWNHQHRHHGNGGQFVGLGYGFGGGFLSSLLYGLGGYGYGGYSNYYGSNGPAMLASLVPPTDVSGNGVITDESTAQPLGAAAARANAFADKGEVAFRAGDYAGAVYAWRHAVIDDPQNPLVLMLLGQALFATGHYDESAGATQAAMHLIPKEQWGVVVTNFRELYGNTLDYTTHIRALEKAEGERPTDPALRFLAGFHYAYLGYPHEAIDQLDKGLKIAPNDEMAKLLRDEMQAKLPKATGAATTPEAAPKAP
jgi:tetratricopeptide (TPR) repeat protein